MAGIHDLQIVVEGRHEQQRASVARSCTDPIARLSATELPMIENRTSNPPARIELGVFMRHGGVWGVLTETDGADR